MPATPEVGDNNCHAKNYGVEMHQASLCEDDNNLVWSPYYLYAQTGTLRCFLIAVNKQRSAAQPTCCISFY